jgi:hypothetical protein
VCGAHACAAAAALIAGKVLVWDPITRTYREEEEDEIESSSEKELSPRSKIDERHRRYSNKPEDVEDSVSEEVLPPPPKLHKKPLHLEHPPK